jgi:hypothetical protein
MMENSIKGKEGSVGERERERERGWFLFVFDSSSSVPLASILKCAPQSSPPVHISLTHRYTSYDNQAF